MTEERPPPPPQKPSAAWALGKAVITLVMWLVVIGAILYITQSYWLEAAMKYLPSHLTNAETDMPTPGTSPQPDPVTERLSSLEDTLAILTEAVNKNRQAPPIPDPHLSDQVDSLTDTVSALEKNIKSLDEKIETQPEPSPALTGSAQEQNLFGLILAQQLNRKMTMGRSISKEIGLLQPYTDPALVPLVTDLADLESIGIPSMPYLKSSFQKQVPSILQADVKPGDGTVGTLLTKLQSIVTVRRVGENVEGNDTDAILARTEAALENDDLHTALDELKSLPQGPLKILDPWLIEANRRGKAEKDSEAILDYFTNKLMQKTPDATTPQQPAAPASEKPSGTP